MLCSECGAENNAGRKFCTSCGAPLSVACPNCAAPLEGNERFCGECGSPVAGSGAAPRAKLPPPAGPSASIRERRFVSVLFADLVGFTTLSEHRDPEDVRDLLTRYFDEARRIVGRYGGAVEKFIGDAVMAVWGTPVATEDDAERAVRAALELIAAVGALGEEAGMAGLQARAGVVSGEAAVDLAAEGQGMVAGDVVNTAARVQSAAQPGTVFVEAVTRRSSEAAILYAEAGPFELKGKVEPLELWRAQRVVAGLLGVLRASGLEAPFVGREREMRLIKELFHSSTEERKAHLVSAIGIAGIGKSRLAWEFEKYIDGLSHTVRWHRGRCLAYGEGVTYWALTEMMKMRAGIVEEEGAESAAAKLRAVIEQLVVDEEEQRWVEPRLAHLLGLEQRSSYERDELFAGWRLFFERMSAVAPTVLVFEDIQWADASLLDFIEYLLEWSRSHALFVLTLGRPELAERRPGWGAGKRNFTSLSVEPISDRAMDELLCGLVPGLPQETRGLIRERAEGVPLYAVETVRMLLDRGLLTREGDSYVVSGEIGDMAVPETLHALIAARLDGLSQQERRLLQDASVAGKSFTKQAVAALNELSDGELEGLLESLVRKDLLTVQIDPMSPERGQYSFLQALMKQISYETLSKKERKARHLAAAEYLEKTSGYDVNEVVEVISSHYVEAYQAAPNALDAQDIKDKARRALAGAGERAASLGAGEEAQRYYEQAAGLTEASFEKGGLLENAGRIAMMRGRLDEATVHFEVAIELLERSGSPGRVARVQARLAEVMWTQGDTSEALRRLEGALGTLSAEDPDEGIADLIATLSHILFFTGDVERAASTIERALDVAEALWLPEILSRALVTKSFVLDAKGRRTEGLALLKQSLEVALEHDLPTQAATAYGNLGHYMQTRDRYEESLQYTDSCLSLTRRAGDRRRELFSLGNRLFPLYVSGLWAQALETADGMLDEDTQLLATLGPLSLMPLVHVNRGSMDEAERMVNLSKPLESSGDMVDNAAFFLGSAVVLRAEARYSEALEAAEQAMAVRSQEGWGSEPVKAGYVEAVEAAFALGDMAKIERLLELVEGSRPVEIPQFVRAHTDRFRARLAALSGDDAAVERGFKSAAGLFREIRAPFYLSVTLLEHAEWLIEQGRAADAEAMLREASETFELLAARPWQERLARSMTPAATSRP